MELITCTANLNAVNINVVILICAFLLGAVVASLVWWYWVRKYDGDLDTKVRDTADKVADSLKDDLKTWIKSEINK